MIQAAAESEAAAEVEALKMCDPVLESRVRALADSMLECAWREAEERWRGSVRARERKRADAPGQRVLFDEPQSSCAEVVKAKGVEQPVVTVPVNVYFAGKVHDLEFFDKCVGFDGKFERRCYYEDMQRGHIDWAAGRKTEIKGTVQFGLSLNAWMRGKLVTEGLKASEINKRMGKCNGRDGVFTGKGENYRRRLFYRGVYLLG